MQATATQKHMQRTDMRIAIVIVTLLCLLTAAAFVTAERTVAPTVVVNPSTLPVPDSIIVRPETFERMRFIEMNQLPSAPQVPIPSIDRQQVIESHRLPEPTPLKPPSAEEIRFREINILPGDDIAFAAGDANQSVVIR